MRLLAGLVILIAGWSLWLLLDPRDPAAEPDLIDKVLCAIIGILIFSPVLAAILNGLYLLIHLLIG